MPEEPGSEGSARDDHREAAEEYRSILAATMDGFWIVDLKGRLLEVNGAYCRMSGYAREELLGMTIPDIEAVETVEDTARHIENVVASGFDRFETRHKTRSGGCLDIELSVVYLRGSGHLACFLRDVTERNRAAAEGRRNEEILRFVLELGRRAPALTEKEVFDLTIEIAVRLTRSLVGHIYLVEEDRGTLSPIGGHPASAAGLAAAGDWRDSIDDSEAWADSVRLRRPAIHNDVQLLPDRSGEREGTAGLRRRLSVPILDGEKVVMVAGVAGKVEPYDEGDAAALQALCVDVVQIVMRKRAESELRKAERHNRAIISAIPDLIFILDYPGGTFLDYHAPDPTGLALPPERFLGRRMADVMPAELAARFAPSLDEAVRTRETQRIEYTLSLPGGETAWEGLVAAVDDKRVLVIARDITQRRAAESMLRLHVAAIEAAANAIVLCDRTGTILYANAAFTTLTGWEREEALGRNPRIQKSGAQEPSFYAELWETILRGRVWRGELTNRRKDGSLYVEEMTITPLLDSNGEVRHLIAVKQDASWRREVDRRIRRSEERYRNLVQGLDVVVWEADPVSWRTTFVNEPAERILGYPVERWRAEESFFLDHVHPDDRAALAFRRELPAVESEDTFRFLAADGRWVWLHSTTRLERDDAGRPSRLRGVMVDVTRHRELELAVRNAADEWTATFDALEAALVVLDPADRVLRLNRAAGSLLGRSWEAILGRPLADLSGAEPWASASGAVAQVRREGQAEVRRADDPFGRIWNVDATRVSRGGASDGRVIVSLREVSQLVKLQESVRRAEAMATLGVIVGAVAHEVRNPLFAMSVNIDALSVMCADREDVREVLGALCHERDRTVKLMNDLLHYGRPASSRRLRGALEPVLALALDGCRSLAQRLGLTLERIGSGAGLEMLLDADRLLEVFENLLDNACQHSPRQGTVSLGVSLRESGGEPYARCTVRDRGKGFSSDVLTRVFEPFFSERKGGIGLGLAIVQRIVEEHGGQVLATNAPDGGAEVIVELPLLGALPGSDPA